MSFSGYQTLLKDPINKSEYSNGSKATLPVPHRRCCQRSQASQETACLRPVTNTLHTNSQSRHGGYKMQVTMTIPNWDLIANVVVVLIFNATKHPRHIEAAAIAMMYMYLYSLAFMDHPCTLGTAICHQAPPCPLYTQPRALRV